MTVKSATKKKLQDLGIAEQHAHELADDRKWDDVVLLTAVQISAICKTDSQTAEGIHKMVQGGGKGSKSDSAPAQTITIKRKKVHRRTTTTRGLQSYDSESKMSQVERDISRDDPLFIQIRDASVDAGIWFTPRIINDLVTGLNNRGVKKLTKKQMEALLASTQSALQKTRVDPFEAVGILSLIHI